MYFFMLAAVSFLAGIVINTILKRSIAKLESESETIEHTGFTFFKQMKLRYDNCIKLGHEINNVENFAKKYLGRYRYYGTSIDGLCKASKTVSGLCLVFGVCGALYDKSHLVEFLLLGFLSMYIVNGLRGLIDIKEAKGRITMNIVDYFESRTMAATKESVSEPEPEHAVEQTVAISSISEENEVINEILREYLS